ncbi:MAG: hypothetical protein ACI91R_001679, partial [Vicingaceae bacterium]
KVGGFKFKRSVSSIGCMTGKLIVGSIKLEIVIC